LHKKIQNENLPATIFAPVSYNQIPSLYAQADIIVFPSLWPEPFGRIAIEAMAAGKPVIGSAIGGIKEIIIPGTGMVVEPGKVEHLREAIKILQYDQKLRIEMGKKGRKIVEDLYSQEKVVEKLIKVYQERNNSF